jgi:hypothetical protein
MGAEEMDKQRGKENDVMRVHMPLFFLLAGFCYSFRQTPDKSWRVG